jgi:hypothetical protein
VQNINAMQVHLGHWVDRQLPRDARLAVERHRSDRLFFPGARIVDLMGLVTAPAIIPYRRDGEAGISRYLAETCPDHLIIFPAWFPAVSRPVTTSSSPGNQGEAGPQRGRGRR